VSEGEAVEQALRPPVIGPGKKSKLKIGNGTIICTIR